MSENLNYTIRNDSIIWGVINDLSGIQVFETNKYFNMISTRLIKLLGYDNKNITSKDIQNEILKTLGIINDNEYEIDEDIIKPGVTTGVPTGIPTVGETIIPHADSTISDFKFKAIDNSLYIENYKTNKSIYIYILKLVKR